MKILKVKSKHGIFEVQVDDEDLEELLKYKWYVNILTKGKCKYTRIHGRISGKKLVKIHRFILKIADPKINIDHIDGDPLNNQKSNLRFATKAQNSRNCHVKLSKSGFRGVEINKNKFCAYISINNKKVHIGSFKTSEEAAKEYDRKAIEVSGEFAVLNYPKEKKCN